jgi:hypothetical protein
MTDTTAVRPVPTRLAARSWPAGLARPPGWIGYIYLHLWLEGYRQIPADGPLFLMGLPSASVGEGSGEQGLERA